VVKIKIGTWSGTLAAEGTPTIVQPSQWLIRHQTFARHTRDANIFTVLARILLCINSLTVHVMVRSLNYFSLTKSKWRTIHSEAYNSGLSRATGHPTEVGLLHCFFFERHFKALHSKHHWFLLKMLIFIINLIFVIHVSLLPW